MIKALAQRADAAEEATARVRQSANDAVVAGVEQTKRMIERLLEQRQAEEVGDALTSQKILK